MRGTVGLELVKVDRRNASAAVDALVLPDYPTPPSFYCNTNKDCAPSQVCSHPPGGPGICQDSKAMACISNNDCSPGETCVLLSNLQTACQITVGGNVPGSGNPIQVGGIGLSCKRDSDCANQERCVDYYGKWQCMATDVNGVNECNTSLDCTAGKICAYSTFTSRNICINPGSIPTIGGNVGSMAGSTLIGNGVYPNFAKYQSEVNKNILLNEDENSTTVIRVSSVDSYVAKTFTISTTTVLPTEEKSENKSHEINVIKTKYAVMREPQVVPKHAVIDPAALPCEFDYQCRMGESCSGVIALVDRNVTVCQYDVAKEDRMCIFHADCLQGQQCTRNKTGTFVCTASIEAALGTVPCAYDYECSGGEKCVNIAEEKKEKVFRCRQPQVKDPRHDQLCRTNAECPYQQVCRRVAGVSLCVDVVASTDPTAMLSIQRKVVKFVQDLLFARL
ncbi:hypothetical protein RB195_009041 [Necator americanus]|uniref:EB module n=1 Tax=Necator americanus TaxID=51031 RepID=A0ABR1CSZ3_NECAM